MQKPILAIVLLFILCSCKEIQKSPSIASETGNYTNIEFATGFQISNLRNHKVITIKNAWPGSDKEFKYALIEKGDSLIRPELYDAVVEIPVTQIVVTSTTHIPSLEMLGVSDNLVGFPNLSYISSEQTRKLIDNGGVAELGKNEDINTEVLLELAPELVVGFAVEGLNKTLTTIAHTGIPVVYNGDWTETSPLGKAEWIKFFGAFFKKDKEADSIFSEIKNQYLKAKEKASDASNKPTVLSGAMYKDIWYLPHGNSWAAQFIIDANGHYLWDESTGTGSLALNLENVLEKAGNADVWIGPGTFSDLQQIKEAHHVYGQFDAFVNNNVYNFTNKKGTTGGILYFELAPNRPDLVLKDIIKILHPELVPNHDLYFFEKLK